MIDNTFNDGGKSQVGIDLGRLPLISCVSAMGLVLLAIGDNDARAGLGWSAIFFWIGLLLIFAPTAGRLLLDEVSREERIGLIIILGLGLYIVKILNSPLFFNYADELKHWRTIQDILQTQHLFKANSILPVSPLYPGLQNTTIPLIELSGIDIFTAGNLMIGLFKILLISTLFLFFEKVSNSAKTASIGVLLYLTNPSFLYFDSQFSYETLAIALISLTLFFIVGGLWKSNKSRLSFIFSAVLSLIALVTTHHVSALFMNGFLLVWSLIYLWKGKHDNYQISPGTTLVLVFVVTFTWMLYVANIVVSYLSSGVIFSLKELLELIMNEAIPRRLFSETIGPTVPIPELIIAYLAVIFLLMGLFISVVYIWKTHSNRAIILALTGLALFYPVTHVLRFTKNGSEYAARFAPYIFIGLSIVLSLGFFEPYLFRNFTRKRWGIAFSAMVIIFMGGIVVSFPYWARMPGPYLVSADLRSIDFENIYAADWMKNLLGSNNRIGTDRVNGLVMGSYGNQDQVTYSIEGVNIPSVFLSSTFGSRELQTVKDGKITDFIVDLRLANSLPILGYYYELGEAKNLSRISLSQLLKYDSMDRISRIYDSGNIIIYDFKALHNAP